MKRSNLLMCAGTTFGLDILPSRNTLSYNYKLPGRGNVTIEPSFDIFGTMTFSWEFFRRHTGRGSPKTEWRQGCLMTRELNPEEPVYSLVPWLLMIPDGYRDEVLRHLARYFVTLPMERWAEPNEDKFKFDAYRSFGNLIQRKMLAAEWPLGGR
jgi:hypothetical protein